MYRASIENEVGWPAWAAFATERGSSLAKHDVVCNCKLKNIARKCSRKTRDLGAKLQ